MVAKAEKDKLRRLTQKGREAFKEAIRINPTKGLPLTDKSLKSPLSRVFEDKDRGVIPMISGRVSFATRNPDSQGKKGKIETVGGKRKFVQKKDKIFSNAVPNGYTPRQWKEALAKIGK